MKIPAFPASLLILILSITTVQPAFSEITLEAGGSGMQESLDLGLSLRISHGYGKLGFAGAHTDSGNALAVVLGGGYAWQPWNAIQFRHGLQWFQPVLNPGSEGEYSGLALHNEIRFINDRKGTLGFALYHDYMVTAGEFMEEANRIGGDFTVYFGYDGKPAVPAIRTSLYPELEVALAGLYNGNTAAAVQLDLSPAPIVFCLIRYTMSFPAGYTAIDPATGVLEDRKPSPREIQLMAGPQYVWPRRSIIAGYPVTHIARIGGGGGFGEVAGDAAVKSTRSLMGLAEYSMLYRRWRLALQIGYQHQTRIETDGSPLPGYIRKNTPTAGLVLGHSFWLHPSNSDYED